ncbi:MAG TPA: Nif11-like leader peptide family natural product precursor [Allosphingosinicella sp.]|nr:Nif11-like leader peptide family natural product precursor [Allosphingosinicella sp.]
MPQHPSLEFIKHAQQDKKLNKRMIAAIEKGGRVTAKEVLAIAKSAGFSFTKDEFEAAVRTSIISRFAAGDHGFATRVSAEAPDSSCAKGCLSWSISYCP